MMGMGVTPLAAAYWVAACSDPGITKGPIHLVTQILADCGGRGTPTLWHVPRHGLLDILSDDAAVLVFRDMAVQAIWAALARDRQGYRGLALGLDYGLTLSFARALRGEQHRRMMAILQDGVWTPSRAARVNAGADVCVFCGQDQADATRRWWHCAAIPRSSHPLCLSFERLLGALAELGPGYDCLWRTGTAPLVLGTQGRLTGLTP